MARPSGRVKGVCVSVIILALEVLISLPSRECVFRRRELGVFFVFMYVLEPGSLWDKCNPAFGLEPRPLAARSFTSDFEKFFLRHKKSPPLFETETLLKSDLWSLERIISSFLLRAP